VFIKLLKLLLAATVAAGQARDAEAVYDPTIVWPTSSAAEVVVPRGAKQAESARFPELNSSRFGNFAYLLLSEEGQIYRAILMIVISAPFRVHRRG